MSCVQKKGKRILSNFGSLITLQALEWLFSRGDTFIGTNDITVEDTWVNFDGSAISGNRFILTMTGYPTLQPNGLMSQNCAVINAFSGSTTYVPEKTQDKSCSTHYSTDMLCYTEGIIHIY